MCVFKAVGGDGSFTRERRSAQDYSVVVEDFELALATDVEKEEKE